MDQNQRLFIAIELPANVLKTIAQIQANLKSVIPERAVRWTRPEGIHLTLKFLGDVRTGQLDEVKAGLTQAALGHAPFELHVQGLGCFPNLTRPRVLWVGITGEMTLLRALQADVEKHIAPLGFPTEERGFSPHLTLGRISQGANRDETMLIGKAAADRDVGRLVSWQVDAVSLMRSHLKPDGAQYIQVARVSLGSS